MRLEAAISAQEAEIAKYRTLKTSVYEDLRDGLITQDEFLHMKQDFSERISFIEDDISGLKTELDAVRAGPCQPDGVAGSIPSISKSCQAHSHGGRQSD